MQANQCIPPPRRSQLTASTVYYACNARFAVVQAGQKGDPGFETADNPANVG